MFFHINQNGLGIDRIWTDPQEAQFISFETDASGEVTAMHTSTRTVIGTKAVITDLASGASFEKGVETNGRITLTEKDVEAGRRYNVRTYVTMSDTSIIAVDSITFLAEPVDGEVVVWAEYASDTRVTITDSNGDTVARSPQAAKISLSKTLKSAMKPPWMWRITAGPGRGVPA